MEPSNTRVFAYSFTQISEKIVVAKERPWFTRIMLLIGAIAFISFALAPLLSSVLDARQVSQQPSSPQETNNPEAQQEELQAQARGYELVLEREPENETALRGLVEVRLQLNDIAGVLEPLEKLAALKPDEMRYTILLAQVKQFTDDLEGAAQIYRKILQQEPGNTQALQGLVELLVKQERPEAAIGLLEETLQLAPEANTAKAGSIDVVAVQLLLGQVYTEQQRFDEALQAYDNTQKANPSDFRPLVGKGLILQRQGKIEEARAILTTASSLAPAQYKDRVDALIAQLDAPTPADVKVDEQQPAADSTNEADPQLETEGNPGTPEPEPVP